jgi:tetratricopeptide (TPR) repeat protein
LAHNNLGLALAGRGQLDAAIAEYQRALKINPDFELAHNNLANALASRGQVDAAIAHYQRALEIKPDFADVHNNLGNALAGRGRFDEAIAHYQRALDIHPDFVFIRRSIENARAQRGRVLAALAQQRELLHSRPKDVSLLNDTAWILATNPNASVRNGPDAVGLAQRAADLTEGREPAILGTLAAAYAEVGRFDEAVASAQQAQRLAEAAGHRELAAKLHARLQLYRKHKPYREPAARPESPG